MGRVVLYNRCDHTAGRAAQLAVSLSVDGRNFQSVYQHDGTVFLGEADGKPLTIALDGQPARSYDAMVSHGSPSLKDLVIHRYREQRSVVGQCEANKTRVSALRALPLRPECLLFPVVL